jgi:heavy metal sensor kinase
VRTFLRRTRVRLTLAYIAGTVLVLGAGCVTFWFVFGSLTLSRIDSSLRGQAQILAAGLRASGEEVLFHGSSVLPSQAPDGSPIGALVVAADGHVVDQAGQPPNPSELLPSIKQATGVGGAPVLETRRIAGVDQRVLVQDIDVGGGQMDTLLLTCPLDEYEQALGLAGALLAITGLLLVAGSALSAYWLAGRALRPVGIITVTARDLSEHSLDRRLTLDLPTDELGTLAATFNQMLDRLETSFATLQRFTADAAHELRGPLTALRSEVEVGLRRLRDPAAYQATLGTVLTETERLTRVVDQLLLLARADAGALKPTPASVDAFDLLEETAERWRPLATRSHTRIVVDLPTEGIVTVDPDLIRRLLNNLIENAIRHTPEGGTVTVGGRQLDGHWQLSVADTGPGVDPRLRATLFQRFSRSDPARGRDTGGAGLGLSLAAAIASAHGGTIELDDAVVSGARFVVDLPQDPGP